MKQQNEKKIKVLLADDHLVVRMGLAAIISVERDMTVVAEASDGCEAVKLATEKNPDVIVMDLMMPRKDGVAATGEILAANPEAKILVLTSFGGSVDVKRALDAGAKSALIKASSQKDLIDALRRTARGEAVLSPEIANTIRSEIHSVELSERQLEILGYVAHGLNNREIANLTDVGRDCVKAHLKTIFSKLGVASRSEAAAYAVNRNLVRI